MAKHYSARSLLKGFHRVTSPSPASVKIKNSRSLNSELSETTKKYLTELDEFTEAMTKGDKAKAEQAMKKTQDLGEQLTDLGRKKLGLP